jgi:hypothetical protein
MLKSCDAMPQASATATVPPTPSATTISWATKIDELRAYILQQPDRNATKGFSSGPSLQKTFVDGQCLQVRFYNWNCLYDIPYKMRGVVKWLDETNVRDSAPVISDPYRWYTYGYYEDPDDGWNFYASARLSFGACGNRGPQSACGVVWCVDKDGNSSGYQPPFEIPKGQTPYVDPNNRSNLCPWMQDDNAMTSHTM